DRARDRERSEDHRRRRADRRSRSQERRRRAHADGEAQQGARQDDLHGDPRPARRRARDRAAQARQGGAAVNLATYARRNLFRRRGRTILTMIAIALAVLIFSVIRTVVFEWNRGAAEAAQDRLAIRHKVSITM